MAQKYGLLIDNYWCTGCHSCEVSCKNEHDLPIGQFGIKMLVLGPWEKHGRRDSGSTRTIPCSRPTATCAPTAWRAGGSPGLPAALPGKRHESTVRLTSWRPRWPSATAATTLLIP